MTMVVVVINRFLLGISFHQFLYLFTNDYYSGNACALFSVQLSVPFAFSHSLTFVSKQNVHTNWLVMMSTVLLTLPPNSVFNGERAKKRKRKRDAEKESIKLNETLFRFVHALLITSCHFPFSAATTSTCRKEQVREYYTENNCRSRQPLKYAKCVGGCGNQCCTANITRRRKVRMVCANNAKYVKTLNIVRKCSCSKKCND